MGTFADFFDKTSHEAAPYRGRLIMIGDTYAIHPDGEMFRITFEHFDGSWSQEQGVVLDTKGEFSVGNQEFSNRIILWQDTYPKTVNFAVKSKSGKLILWNAWNFRDTIQPFLPPVHFGMGGAAMTAEDLPNGRRYYCNDGYPDDDFNDLIFRIERIDPGHSALSPSPPNSERLFSGPPTDEFIDPLLCLPESHPRRLMNVFESFGKKEMTPTVFGEKLLKHPDFFHSLMNGYKHKGEDLYAWLAAQNYREMHFRTMAPTCKVVREFLKRWKAKEGAGINF